MRPLFLLLALTACDRIAANSTVANTLPVRLAMLSGVEVGLTTETAFATRWGNPTHKVHEGGQVEYVYRQIVDPAESRVLQSGRSDAWVIVTFRYGVATGARSSDTERCRATFPPRPPGHGFSTPGTVRPAGDCSMWEAMARGLDGGDSTTDEGAARRPGVPPDNYRPGGRAK